MSRPAGAQRASRRKPSMSSLAGAWKLLSGKFLNLPLEALRFFMHVSSGRAPRTRLLGIDDADGCCLAVEIEADDGISGVPLPPAISAVAGKFFLNREVAMMRYGKEGKDVPHPVTPTIMGTFSKALRNLRRRLPYASSPAGWRRQAASGTHSHYGWQAIPPPTHHAC